MGLRAGIGQVGEALRQQVQHEAPEAVAEESGAAVSDARLKDYVMRAVMEDSVLHNMAKLMMLDQMSMNTQQRVQLVRNRWGR